MAAVYQANDTRQGHLVAIKEMSLSTVPENDRPQAIQNFLAEARILSRLNHPNLPAFTDFFTEGARHFLVMEYIDGSTLEDKLDRNKGSFSEPRVLGWARQLCDVLEYLHNQQPPVIFRDMKPSNVMLTQSGRIKLIDFGIARLFRSRGSQDTQLLGTPGFAPPEQYGSAQTDERSDIYSLAMTLFQLLTCSISENGFGLTNVHVNFPHISPPVARALEKATSLRPEDRYESIVVFRRALLREGSFQFESGGEATTPEELADLCAHYSTEAAEHLYSGEIESWLSEIGEHDLARATKRIRATVGDPEMGVNRFLQVVMGPNAQTRNYIPTSTVGSSNSGRTSTGTSTNSTGSRISWPTRTRDSRQVVVRPKTIDFEEIYPGLSHPILLTISGVKGALVKGTLRSVESWIVLDKTVFDGMSTSVRVRADTTRLRGSTHYTGTILVKSDNKTEEILVKVEVDVLGFDTYSGQTTIGQTAYSEGIADANDQTLQQNVTSTQKNTMAAQVTAAGSSTNTPGSTSQVNQPYTSAKDSEYKKKYGLPGSDGWQVLQTTPKQASKLHIGMTFFASCMAAAFFYLLLSHITPNAQASLLPPNPWFIAVLVGLVPFAAAGATLVNLGSSWSTREIISRVCTGLTSALIVLGIGDILWQNVLGGGTAPPFHLILMILLTAAGATIGSLPSVSNRMISIGMWMMQHMRWLMIALAVVIGGGLGFALTSGIAFGCFTPFGILLGVGVGVALVLRLNRLLKLKQTHP
jgi:serine/threonine protein kinase